MQKINFGRPAGIEPTGCTSGIPEGSELITQLRKQ